MDKLECGNSSHSRVLELHKDLEAHEMLLFQSCLGKINRIWLEFIRRSTIRKIKSKTLLTTLLLTHMIRISIDTELKRRLDLLGQQWIAIKSKWQRLLQTILKGLLMWINSENSCKSLRSLLMRQWTSSSGSMNQETLSPTMNSENKSSDSWMGKLSETYNRVDKINMNNIKIVSPEKTG